MLRRY